MTALPYGKARRASKALLVKHGITEPPVDVRLLAEREGITFESTDLEEEVSGFLIQDRERTILALNTHHAVVRQRFTIAHALAHHQLHAGGDDIFIYDLLVYFRGTGLRWPAEVDLEANAFAQALLMPAEFLRRDFKGRRIDVRDDAGMRQMAQRYQVSVAALTIRLVELRMLRGALGGGGAVTVR